MAKRTIKSHTQLLREQFQPELRVKEQSTGISAYELWHSRIQAALSWREQHWNGDVAWKRAYRLYGGKHWRFSDEENPSADEARDLITVNITMSTVNNLVPYLVNSNPFFVLKARQPSGTVSAMLQQEILNYQFQLQNCIDQLKEVAHDAAIIGHGIAKSGFTYELDEAATKKAGNIVYDDLIREETPFIRRIDPFCFIYDPTAPDRTLKTARWAGEYFFSPFDDVVANTRYDPNIRNKIKNGEVAPKMVNVSEEYGTGFASGGESIYDGILESTPRIIKLFEIWDKKYRKRFIFADGVTEPLLEDDWPYEYLKSFPYRRLEFIKLPNEHYPVGIPYSIEDQQFELDRHRTAMFQHRRRFNRKYEVADSVDEVERNKLLAGEDGTFVVVKQLGSVQPIADAPLPSDYWNLEGIIKGDVQELSGMDSLIRGGPLPSRTTGQEVNTRANLFRMKIDDLVDRTDKFVLAMGKDFLAHIKGNFLKERVVHIVGKQGEFWVRATPEDIQEEVDVTMESVAAPKTDPTLDKQQSLQLLQIVTQAMGMAQKLGQQIEIDFNELFAWVIEKFGYKDVGRFFRRALMPTPPLEEGDAGQISNNLKPAGSTPEAPMTAADLQNQTGIASIMNAGGLQL